MSTYKIAIAQYPIEFVGTFQAYEEKITRWVYDAAQAEAKLLLFSEYGSMELVSCLEENIRADLEKSVEGMMQFWPQFDALHEKLAKLYGVYILASSFPKDRKNVSAFYGPQGKIGEQGKEIMTRFEREQWKIGALEGRNVFQTPLGKIGIAICYDAEFPLLVRKMIEQGAEVILVPSCTDSLAGYHRVKIGAQARALENQCYVAQSPTVGEAPWSPATDVNIGAAGLFGPPDIGFPDDGILELGPMNEAGWVYGEINLSRVGSVRRHGAVLNYTHWDEQ